MIIKILSFKGNVFGIEPPTFVDYYGNRARFQGRQRQCHKTGYTGNRRNSQSAAFINQGDITGLHQDGD